MVRVSWLDRELRELEVTELGVGRGETFLPCTWSIEEYGVVQRSKEATPLEERQDSRQPGSRGRFVSGLTPGGWLTLHVDFTQ